MLVVGERLLGVTGPPAAVGKGQGPLPSHVPVFHVRLRPLQDVTRESTFSLLSETRRLLMKLLCLLVRSFTIGHVAGAADQDAGSAVQAVGTDVSLLLPAGCCWWENRNQGPR